MRLELRKIKIENIIFGNETTVNDKILQINKEELISEMKKIDNVKDIKIDIAKPGDKTRIIPVKDVIEPRYKVEGIKGFAGITSEVGQLGDGVVNKLDGVAIVTIGDIVGFQEGIIDMWGEGAKWTPFSKTMNIVVDISVIDGLHPHEHEETCRIVGLKASEYIGLATKDILETENVEIYEMEDNATETAKYPNLPKVVYVEMLITQGLLHDSYIYGVNAAHILPTLLAANEELDGAIVSGNCVAACDKITTYQHQNNNIIKELYKIHGKEINFIGVIPTPEMTTLNGKLVTCDYTAKLCKLMGANGVIISEEGYGNPDSDLVMISSRLEKLGIKTVLITDECSGWDGLSQPLTDTAKEAVAVISTGNVSHVIELDKADLILGDAEAIANLAGGWDGAYDKETGKMKCELNAVIGATSEIGYHNATIELV